MKVAIKRSLQHFNYEKEATFMKLLNKHGIGPKFVAIENESVVMEYIDGKRILKFFATASKKNILTIISECLKQIGMLDKLSINKLELTNPYKHIIIRNNLPIMIDFERCTYTTHPKNTTQFIQFLTSGKLAVIFKEKDITVDRERLRALRKETVTHDSIMHCFR